MSEASEPGRLSRLMTRSPSHQQAEARFPWRRDPRRARCLCWNNEILRLCAGLWKAPSWLPGSVATPEEVSFGPNSREGTDEGMKLPFTGRYWQSSLCWGLLLWITLFRLGCGYPRGLGTRPRVRGTQTLRISSVHTNRTPTLLKYLENDALFLYENNVEVF